MHRRLVVLSLATLVVLIGLLLREAQDGNPEGDKLQRVSAATLPTPVTT